MLLFLLGCLVDRDAYEKRLAELTDDDGDGATEVSGDCDDADSAVFPAATEQCNDRDDDCDGRIDEAEDVVDAEWYPDADADGYGSGEAVITCAPTSTLVGAAGDCDDTDADRHPGAAERCNDLDDDCDDATDEPGEVETLDWYADADGDGYGTGEPIASCANPGGASLEAGDCDDADAAENPGATETCNGADDDCNGATDDAPAITWYLDRDGDGFGDDTSTYLVCSPPPGYAPYGGDCDDSDAERSPGSYDVCEDGLDGDCDGLDAPCGIPTGDADLSDVSARFTGDAGETYVARTVASAGDLDGDGDDELVVARPGWDGMTGKVHIVPGGSELYLGEYALDDVGVSIEGTARESAFGVALGAGEDVDADGVPDLAVATYGADVVYLFGGAALSAGDADTDDAWATLVSEEGSGSFGASVALAGDVDDDGLGDVLVGDPQLDGIGAAWLFYGGEETTTEGAVRIDGGEVEDQAGQEVCSTGDVDGDGIGDWIVAKHITAGGDDVRGGGYLFFGSTSRRAAGRLDDADVTYEGAPTEALFDSCSGLGDFNGDGGDDFAFAGIGYEAGRGATFLVTGSASPSGGPVDAVADSYWVGDSGSGLGGTVSGPGDLDQDGFTDLLVTTTRDSGASPVAYAFAGSSVASGAGTLEDATLALVGGNTSSEGEACSGPLDLNGDGVLDLGASAWAQADNRTEAWVIYGAP